jgi:hypothetical protein
MMNRQGSEGKVQEANGKTKIVKSVGLTLDPPQENSHP